MHPIINSVIMDTDRDFIVRIQSVLNFNFFNYGVHSNNQRRTILPAQQPDVFVKSTAPSFLGNTSAGNPLKRLTKINCPYFDIPMLSGSEVAKIDRKLPSCTTIKKVVHYLKKYEKNMQTVERAVFRKFETAADDAPRTTIPEILKQWYTDALIRLKLEEFSVLDDIEELSKSLSPHTEFEVRKIVNDCGKIILDDNPFNPFKRKTLLSSLNKIRPADGEEAVFEKLRDRANYLPTSSTSINAFIVKYAYRSHNEIARRLILPSFATIEHIRPDSMGGKNEIKNFLLTSAGANNLRQNMPLDKYIEMFPQIPGNCQKYIDQIINILNHGGLRGNETYPYEVSKTLKKESKGKIKLDLSKYRLSKEEAKIKEENVRNAHKGK